LSGMIKSTIQLALDDTSKMNNVDACLVYNQSTRSLGSVYQI
jgi:hypothetical protein